MKKLGYRIYRKSPKPFKRGFKFIKKNLFEKKTTNSFLRVAQKGAKNLDRLLSSKGMEYVSFQDMVTLCDALLPKLGRNFDVIVGIPGSGLLVANILSLKLGKPLTTPENVKTHWLSKSIELQISRTPTILLVDDSYQSGASMMEAFNSLVLSGVPRGNIKTAALITSRKGVKELDHYCLEINEKRLFEWNLVHKKMNVVTDLDGVLCEDPPEDARIDDAEYERWITSAKPLVIPTFKINTILTSRIEKYRNQTESWLKDQGVKYGRLVMSIEDTREAQKKAGLVHKVKEINELHPEIYWESGSREARELLPLIQCPILVFEEKIILSK